MTGWPASPEVLSHPVARVDGPAKVTGAARYSSDQQPPGWLYGMMVYSPYAAAEITAIDLEAARKIPGVKAALLVRDLPRTILYYGEELAAVAATTKQACLDAVRAIKITATARPHVVTDRAALAPGAPRVFPEHPNLAAEPHLDQKGDVEAALAGAPVVVEAEIDIPVQIHHALETHGNTVDFSGGQELKAWASTQAVFGTRDGFASGVGIPQNKVEVVCEYMGGGFGAKFNPGVEGLMAARLSKEAGAPVRLMLTRLQEGLSVGNRPSSHQKVKAAAQKDGAPAAFDFEGYGSAGVGSGGVTAGGGGGARIPMPYLYKERFPAYRSAQRSLALNTGHGRAFRAPGHPQASLGMEMILDELCAKLGADPVAWRIAHDPSETRRRQYAYGAEKFGWKGKYQPPGSQTGAVRKGVGVAGATWGGGGRGSKCEVRISSDGAVEVRIGTQDLGTGTRTIVAAIAAEAFGLEPSRIDARIGQTAYPFSGGSGGSTTAASVSPAVWDACQNALAELQRRAGVPDARGSHFGPAARTLGVDLLVAQGQWREGLSSSNVGGAQFAEVTVDTETGFVKADRILCVQDCGLVVNPLTTQSQIYGGIVMGLSYALYEERVMDQQTGVLLNPNFETYKLAGISDIPAIDIFLSNHPERGVIGIGEPATVPTAAAIANAVANALGRRIARMPITPARVLDALHGGRA